jgi:hypothetical protein
MKGISTRRALRTSIERLAQRQAGVERELRALRGMLAAAAPALGPEPEAIDACAAGYALFKRRRDNARAARTPRGGNV